MNEKQHQELIDKVSEAVLSGTKAAFVSGVLVEPETHEKHHRWTHDQMQREQACVENRRKITNHVLGWLAVSFLSGIAFLLWLGYTTYINNGG